MANSDLRGIISAATTPVDSAFQIEPARLARHCERLLSEGCSFVSTFGTTGEGASFSSAQKIAALEALKAEGAELSRHIPAVMTPAADEAARMIAAAARLGCRGALVLPPFYYDAPTHEGIAAFFDDVLDKAGRPDIDLLLYHIPQFSRIAYTPPLIEKLLARFGSQIVGLKDSTGVAENAITLAERFPQLSIFTGDDRVMPGLVLAGGAGMIGGMPNLFSSDLRKIYDAPDGDGTRELRQRAAQRIVAADKHGSLLALKAALAALYRDAEWARAAPPLVGLNTEEASRVLSAFAETGYVPNHAA